MFQKRHDLGAAQRRQLQAPVGPCAIMPKPSRNVKIASCSSTGTKLAKRARLIRVDVILNLFGTYLGRCIRRIDFEIISTITMYLVKLPGCGSNIAVSSCRLTASEFI